ncbi:molybdenum cofactor guanylyltransferase MobA [Roseateles sp.]|uniref:molybdenum cofactor guanylyltransferase MobA n=1 Tax=Roseateles sp. TaxID=1971397 RepID=UPI003BA47DBE
MPIPAEDITGLVLAGGRGSRMGGVDKGLQNHLGMPLALHSLLRLQGQVGSAMLNANRNLGAYESMGVPVWPDSQADFAGPLAGMLVGLEHCETPWLVTVPCDTPNFPNDLVERLAAAAQAEDAEIAMAATREPDEQGQTVVQVQPVFCLLKSSLLESMQAFLDSGQRKIDRWTAQHRCATVVFDDSAEFFNANTMEELRKLG